MYFCSDCDYSYDIEKANNELNKISLNKPDELLKKIKDKEKLDNYVAEFTMDDFKKYSKNLKPDDIKKIQIVFDNKNISKAIFVCNNCGKREPIRQTILLYSLNTEEKCESKTMDEIQFMINNPILPRTKDYICGNPNCISHKKIDIKKAVFYRDDSSFKINYICCVCYSTWQ